MFTDFGPLREIARVPGLPQGWSLDVHASDLVRLLSDPAAREERVLDHIFYIKVVLTQGREPLQKMRPQRAAEFRQELVVSPLVPA